MHTNRLAKEKSPYLLQHKHNPVDWYPWSEEAFAKAEKENKLIFLSIGYSTCYWCHVMEKDSFELDDVAEILNKHYVAIKVDREERPDVDQIYMDAIITISGRGGWPMSVFLKPDRTPFFGGTFFWRDQFKQILTQVADTWKDNPDKVNQSAKSLFSALENRKIVAGDGDVDEEVFQQVFGQLKSSFDSQYGGFGRAPKFPHSENVAILLRIHRRSGNKEALRMAEETLQKIAYGGIYDHLGGGFARYSTDEKWLVPHFEKMLYDNGLLTAVYLDAARATGNTLYSDIAADTLNYVLREMTSNEGGFYSAQDAGEVNKEGEFYVWKEEELKDILEEKEFKEIKSLYGVSKEGNFEHNNNVLHIVHPNKWSDKSKPLVKSAQKKLFEYRDQKREHPHKDDKILTSWNGLMITAMAKGYQVLGDKRYLEAAQKAAAFIKKELFTGERLLRRYRDGEAGFAAYVDDYAFLIQGLLDLYESDFDQQWLEFAKELQSIQDKLLWDNKEDGYFFAEAESKDLILRKKDYNDGALPSGNSISALNLLRLHDLYFERDYLEKAKDIFAAMSGGLERYPSGFGAALVALDYFFDSSKEIVAVGPHDSKESQELKDYLHKNFNPSRVIAFGQGVSLEDSKAPTVFRGKQVINKKTTFYVCENHTCKAPTTDVAKAKQQIEEFKKLAIN